MSTLHVVTAFRPITALMTNPAFATVSAAAYADLDPSKGAAEVTGRASDKLDGITVEQHQVAGSAADALCEVADKTNADLIVVGSRGMTGTRRVLGSVPNSVAHAATCSVLIVQTQK